MRGLGTGMSTVLVALVGVALLSGGCDVKSFLDQSELVDPKPSQDMNLHPLIVPVISYIDEHEETSDTTYATAIDPRPEDLLPSNGDYKVGPNDDLQVTISDLQGPGTESVKVVKVAESGRISLPYLYQIQAAGLTEAQLEQSIAAAYKDANLIANAQVSVQVQTAMNRTFSISGAVAQPGEYSITRNDFRLLDALSTARDVVTPIGVDEIYIIRKTGNGETTQPTENNGQNPSNPDILAPHSQNTNSPTQPQMMDAAAGDAAQPANAMTALPATQPTDQEGRYVVVGGQAQLVDQSAAPTTAPSSDMTAVPTTEATTEPSASEPATAPGMSEVSPTTQPEETADNFRFRDLKPPADEIVIRVPYDRLRRGELQFNLVIRPGDFIEVPPPVQGFFQVGGHVARVGSYTLNPHNTVIDAIIAAGMLDQVGVPERTQLIRRLPGDRELWARINLEKIFVGEAPDIYLKPDDRILVGTNPIATFLAALRNGFRITYGFGFLYDRNYWNPTSNNGGGD
jgi:protein involved in polysaccharide export with SLBB domain